VKLLLTRQDNNGGVCELVNEGLFVVAAGVDFRPHHRAFEDGPSKFPALQIAPRPQRVTLILKPVAFFDGELGTGKQGIGHAHDYVRSIRCRY
jgi:hypothetical protein